MNSTGLGFTGTHNPFHPYLLRNQDWRGAKGIIFLWALLGEQTIDLNNGITGFLIVFWSVIFLLEIVNLEIE